MIRGKNGRKGGARGGRVVVYAGAEQYADRELPALPQCGAARCGRRRVRSRG